MGQGRVSLWWVSQTDQPLHSAVSQSRKLISDRRPGENHGLLDATLQFMNNPGYRQ
jgi:hypothetical protein